MKNSLAGDCAMHALVAAAAAFAMHAGAQGSVGAAEGAVVAARVAVAPAVASESASVHAL